MGGKKHICTTTTAQKMKFYINDFFSKCDLIRRKLRIWSYLLDKSLMENFIFSAVHFRKPPKSSRAEVFLGKVVVKICSKFTGEHPFRSVFSIKLQSNFIEIALRHGCSPVNLLHIFKKPFPKNTSGWLFLNLLFILFFRTCSDKDSEKSFATVIYNFPVWNL